MEPISRRMNRVGRPPDGAYSNESWADWFSHSAPHGVVHISGTVLMLSWRKEVLISDLDLNDARALVWRGQQA